MTPRIFLPSLKALETTATLPAQPLALDDASAHHLLRVLRHRPGEPLEVFDGGGRAWTAELESTQPPRIRLLRAQPAEAPPPVCLGLAQCLSTADKMDWTIEKAVELGVSRIMPLLSARSVVKLDAARAEKRLAHWQRLIVAASMQSQRNRLPTIQPVQQLSSWLGSLPAAGPDERRWVLWPEAQHALAVQASSSSAVPAAPTGDTNPASESGSSPASGAPAQPAGIQTAWLLCGPESGLSDEEVRLALAAGWQGARLGPRVLRTETAGLVGLAVLQTVLGDLR